MKVRQALTSVDSEELSLLVLWAESTTEGYLRDDDDDDNKVIGGGEQEDKDRENWECWKSLLVVRLDKAAAAEQAALTRMLVLVWIRWQWVICRTGYFCLR